MTGYRTEALGRVEIDREYADVTTPPPACSPTLPLANPNPLDRYDLLDEVGRGGMGVLIRAHDRLLRREVVIKLLREDLAGCRTAERRFLREARINGQLQHPGIVPVYDVGRFPDGRPFLTMKFVSGRTLESRLDARAHVGEEFPFFLEAFAQVCQTVAYAHAKGVIHRDLKPANVMTARFAQVRVLDWGLAQVMPGMASMPVGPELPDDCTERYPIFDIGGGSVAGAIVGTPAFMPPEQARGEPLDERADVFGLGAILGMILTGRPPYMGLDLPGVWQAAKAADLGPIQAALAQCRAPAEWVQLALACLATSPYDRPADAGAVSKLVAAYRGTAGPRRGSWFGRLVRGFRDGPPGAG